MLSHAVDGGSSHVRQSAMWWLVTVGYAPIVISEEKRWLMTEEWVRVGEEEGALLTVGKYNVFIAKK